jgi:hypothetical protein
MRQWDSRQWSSPTKHLEKTNRALQTQMVKFQSQHFTDKNRIAALEKELKKGQVRVTIKRLTRPPM